MDDLNRLALEMQELLTHTADRIARECGFVKHVRTVTDSNFAQAVIFTCLGEPGPSQSGLQGVAATVGLNLSRQGLDQRFTPVAAEFLKRNPSSFSRVAISGAVCPSRRSSISRLTRGGVSDLVFGFLLSPSLQRALQGRCLDDFASNSRAPSIT